VLAYILVFFLYEKAYSYLNASIGLSLAALFAGKIPNTIPIVTAEKNDNKTAFKDIIAVKKLFIRNTRIKLKIIQMIHHITLKVTDSTRN
jgi:hypothetical protein